MKEIRSVNLTAYRNWDMNLGNLTLTCKNLIIDYKLWVIDSMIMSNKRIDTLTNENKRTNDTMVKMAKLEEERKDQR